MFPIVSELIDATRTENHPLISVYLSHILPPYVNLLFKKVI